MPAYSPYAVAEHAVALLLALNRKIPRANNRVHDLNFSLNGLVGFDLHGKTAGIIGTGKIGRVVAEVLNDDLLHVAVPAVQVADREQRVHAVFWIFADSDQQSGGEGNRLLSRFFDGAQAFGWDFVRGVIVGAAGAEQRRVRRLKHQAHAG